MAKCPQCGRKLKVRRVCKRANRIGPKPADIAAMAQSIRAGWTAKERRKRDACKRAPVTVPVVRTFIPE